MASSVGWREVTGTVCIENAQVDVAKQQAGADSKPSMRTVDMNYRLSQAPQKAAMCH